MLTEKAAVKLVLQELGASPNALRTTLVHNGEIKMYLVHMGHYDVKVTACDEATLLMTIWRNGQSISTYYDAETLKEDKTRTQIELRAVHAETVRNAILKHGVDWCKQVYDDWETLIQVELDEAMGLGLYPDPSKDSDCT